MAKACCVCEKSHGKGHLVSHSNRKTLRRYEGNIQVKRLYNPRVGKMVRVKICTGCLKTYQKKGGNVN